MREKPEGGEATPEGGESKPSAAQAPLPVWPEAPLRVGGHGVQAEELLQHWALLLREHRQIERAPTYFSDLKQFSEAN